MSQDAKTIISSKDTKGVYQWLALLSAAIWGGGFAFQKSAMEFLTPFAFSSLRMATGGLVVFFLILFIERDGLKQVLRGGQVKHLARASLVPAIFLAIITSIQQVGLVFGLASKAGFILSLYVCIVPFIAVFIGYKIKGMEIVAALVALVGVILLTLQEGLSIGLGDSFFLIVAVSFAIYLLTVDYYGRNLPPMLFTWVQVVYGAIITGVIAMVFEGFNPASLEQLNTIWDVRIELFYGGPISIGLSLTLQVICQKYISPGKMGILMCATALFATLGGWLLLGELLNTQEIIGAAFILASILLIRVKPKGATKAA